MHAAAHARSTAAPCLLLLANAGLLSRNSRPTHLQSQIPRKGMALAGFGWDCVWKGMALAGEEDHLPTRSGLNQGPSMVVHLGLVGTRIRAGICDCRCVGRELRLSRPAFASSSRQGAAVERACAAACMQAKFVCSESAICAYRLACQEANEQLSRAQGGSEPGRRGASRATTTDQVRAAAVVGECANSGQRGCFAYTCGPHGVPQEYARCGGKERNKGPHQ